MSLITHPCTECGHPDYWRPGHHTKRSEHCPQDGCGCACTPGQPELKPTFDIACQPIERIIKPGEPLYAGTPTCGCGLCVALYTDLTGAEA